MEYKALVKCLTTAAQRDYNAGQQHYHTDLPNTGPHFRAHFITISGSPMQIVHLPMMVGFIHQIYSSTIYKKPSVRENFYVVSGKWLLVVELSLYHFMDFYCQMTKP